MIEKITPQNSRAHAVLLLIGMICILVLQPCLATEASLPTEETALETITVTAQKREEDVQKVTTSITVLSDMAIEDAGIESTQDIWRYVPNLFTTHEGSRDYFYRVKIRGISNTGFGDPAVALYIDDVSYAGVYAFNSPLFDIERIEVLKGPQGTLYGKSTEGGAINIVTKNPGNAFDAKINIEAGDYNKRQLSGLINAPLIEDKLFFRVAGLYSAHDGYIKNVFNGQDIDNQETVAANAGLFFTPSDNLLIDLKFRVHEYDDDGGYPAVPMDRDKYQAVTGLTGLDDFEIGYDYSAESSSKTNSTSLRVKYEQDSFDLISVTAYRDMDNFGGVDPDYTPLKLYFGYQEVESQTITQELRIQSKDSDKSFKWLLGVYYSNEKKDYGGIVQLDELYADMYGVPLYTEEANRAELGACDMAVFGQSTLRFFENALGLTAGLRYERSKRTLDNREHTFAGAPVADPITGLDNTDSLLLPKLALDYLFSDNIMAYASVAKGYKPGGFAYAVDDPALADFDPELSTAFELGVKTQFPTLGLRVNAAFFYTKVDDYQDRVQLDAFTVYQANVTETDIYGFELEASFALTDNLSLNGFIGYTHAEYGQYIDPMLGIDYQGNLAANVPEYNAGLFLEYRNRYGIFARAEMQNIGSCYFDRANVKKQSAYTLYNMKIGYERNKWDVYLALENLTNEQYFLEAYEDTGLGLGWLGTVGDPRTISVALNYKF